MARSQQASANGGPAQPPGRIARAMGMCAAVFGVALTVLTIAGAIDGYAAIGFYDICIGGMIVAFGLQSIKFGFAVSNGRQTITGHLVSS